LSERPHRVRTWAPRGQTPVLQHHFNWKVLGEFKRPSQHLDRRSCDGYSKAPFRSMRASTLAVTGSASGSKTGELSAVLGSDCSRPVNRGRCYRRRSVARRGWPVVPEGWRHDTFPCFAVFKAPVGSLSVVCRARSDRHLALGFRSMAFAPLPASLGGPLRKFYANCDQRQLNLRVDDN